jgi:hypothetical protein
VLVSMMVPQEYVAADAVYILSTSLFPLPTSPRSITFVMFFSKLMPLASVFVATAAAWSSHDDGNKHFDGFKKVPILCKGLKTEDNGCTRCKLHSAPLSSPA